MKPVAEKEGNGRIDWPWIGLDSRQEHMLSYLILYLPGGGLRLCGREGGDPGVEYAPVRARRRRRNCSQTRPPLSLSLGARGLSLWGGGVPGGHRAVRYVVISHTKRISLGNLYSTVRHSRVRCCSVGKFVLFFSPWVFFHWRLRTFSRGMK
jgi:hypothetical protein